MVTGAGMELVRELSGAATGSLIGAVWQGALLAGAAALGLRMLPRTPAAVRFAIWFAVFAATVALPFAPMWGQGGTAPGVFAGGSSAWLTLDERWSEGVLLVWAVTSMVRLGMLITGAIRVRALWKRATPIEIPRMVEGHAGETSAWGRKIEICTSDEVDRPSVIGFFAPRILIPTWLIGKLTPEEMAQVVRHEAGHLRRADDWLNLLQKIALVLFPLNPALAWVERRLCFERELACDEEVLQATGAPKAYASCLASLAEHRMTRRGMALVMGALGRESELGQRVRRILARGERMPAKQARLVMGGAICALLAGAVGLEHCPQLVGFAAGPDDSASLRTDTAGLRYQDVVYRPSTGAVKQVRAVDTVLRQSVVAQAPLVDSRSKGKTRATEALTRPAPRRQDRSQEVRHAAAGTREQTDGNPIDRAVAATEWVVMTSWSADAGDNGARVVMTSVATIPPGQSLSAALAGVQHDAPRSSAAPARRMPAVHQVPMGQQFSPYAAVPVRGGWLVIQL